jgi:uncharacterized protein (DUF433 family)
MDEPFNDPVLLGERRVLMTAAIIDRGRGPEIEGTRITVFDIMDYVEDSWHPARIATFLSLSTGQVLAAIQYIEDHKEELMPQYLDMLERCAQGNPPEIEARRVESHAKLMAKFKDLELKKVRERRDAWHASRHQHPGSI